MNAPEENDPIEKLLRDQETIVPDAGFTRRVMANLPQRRYAWARPVILLSAAAVGAVLAYLWIPWNALPPLDFSQVISSQGEILWPWMAVVAVAAALGLAIRTAVVGED